MKQTLGDFMKSLESITTNIKLIPRLPIIVRLDGKSFHTFTKGLKRPYDERLSQIMIDTTEFLVKTFNAKVGYTQSDEISLILYAEDIESQLPFDGKYYKLNSIIASTCTAYFNRRLEKLIPEKYESSLPVFDCRVFNAPTLLDACNCLLWRELDATKNSITMASLSVYSTKEIHKKNSSQKQEMLFAKGINWNDYPDFFKKGTYIRKRLNEKNRSEYYTLDIPPLSKISNKVEVLLYGEEPLPYTEEKG